MPSIDTIKMARVIGLENVTALNNLKKLAKKVKASGSSEPFTAEAKLSLTTEQYEALQKMYTQRFNVPTNAAEIMRRYSPATYAPGNTINTTVKVKKFGKGSGKVEASANDTAGTVETKMKILGNDSGVRFVADGKNADIATSSVDVTYLKDAPKINPFDIARSAQVSEADGVTKMVIPGNVKGGLRVKSNVEMKTDVIDDITAESTKGEITKFSELMENAKNSLLP